MKTVFADAFYFVALLNRADQHHAKVIGFARQLRDDVLTTEWVLAEFADALAASSARSLVPQFVHELERDPKVKIIPANGDLFRRGFERYAERPDKQWSLTDCVSFVAMEDAELREALTGDRHFEQAGFIALLK